MAGSIGPGTGRNEPQPQEDPPLSNLSNVVSLHLDAPLSLVVAAYITAGTVVSVPSQQVLKAYHDTGP